jgi:hypothetical protein
MTDRPIIFSAPMVRALLDGRKTQTRRLAWRYVDAPADNKLTITVASPWQRVQPGDRLWVRESVRAEELSRPPAVRAATAKERQLLHRTQVVELDDLDGADGVRYAADNAWCRIQNTREAGDAWSKLFHYRGRGTGQIGNLVPSIHMPRWASRITLHVETVRVERLQEISRGDAMAEGCPFQNMAAGPDPRDWFRDLWLSVHGPGAWEANPEVVALTFRVALTNIDAANA